MEAHRAGDPIAIGQASQRVIALGLVQMARIRLDAKSYDEAANLCASSLEFEDTAETRIELAIADLYAKKLADAVKQATMATEMDPQNALAWTIKGETLLKNQDYAGAAAALQRSIDLKEDVQAVYSLGAAQLELGDKGKAADNFNKMLAILGDSGWSRVLVGRAYLQQNLSQLAINEFQKALRIDPRTPDANYFWGRTLLQSNSWLPTPDVVSHLQEELKINPRHFLSNYLLGIFARMDRNIVESDRYFRIAAELNPSLPEIWMYLGLNAIDGNKNRLAEAYLQKAVTLTEKGDVKDHLSVRRAYFVLGRILMSSGKNKEGEELLKKGQELQVEAQAKAQQDIAKRESGNGFDSASEKSLVKEVEGDTSLPSRLGHIMRHDSALPSKNNLSASAQEPATKAEQHLQAVLGSSFNDLATAEALQEKYDLALKHYRDAASWDSHIPGLQRNLGLATFFAGQPADAVKLLSTVVTHAPSDSHARAVLGMAYVATRDFARAVQTIRPIANLALQDSQLGVAWAKSLAETGDKTGAARALQEIEKANPNLDVDRLIQFGHLWQELGSTDHAEESFRRALLIDPKNADAKCALHLSPCT